MKRRPKFEVEQILRKIFLPNHWTLKGKITLEFDTCGILRITTAVTGKKLKASLTPNWMDTNTPQ